MILFLTTLIGISDVSPCLEKIDHLPKSRVHESSLEVLDFIAKLRDQREKELKSLRSEVLTLKRILEAKANWKAK